MNNEFYGTGQFTPGNPSTPLYYSDIASDNRPTSPPIPSPNINGTDTSPEYIEDVLKEVEPVKATFYMTFTGSEAWLDKKFTGILEYTGREHVIISDPTSGNWYLLPNIYMDYIEFHESLDKYLKM